MLLEELVEKAARPAEYDWDEYVQWLFRQTGSRNPTITDHEVWQCGECRATNVVALKARYGKCRKCGLLYLRNPQE